MQSASFMPELSLGQDPRDGQKEVFIKAQEPGRQKLNVKLPTGYGKTFTAYVVFHILKRSGLVDRLLFVAPTSAQIAQLVDNCDKDYRMAGLAGLAGIRQAVDLRLYGDTAIKHHRKGSHVVYATTPQSLIQRTGNGVARDLLGTGKWMIVIDEYHHYGIDAKWGMTAASLPCAFLLAMSATPNRPGDDSAFGKPEVNVTYEDAREELAVKPLLGHSYVYRVDAIDECGDVLSYTTTELAEQAGSNDPTAIEKLRINRKLRWSPKYISPLVSVPLERMLEQRLETGRKLRAIAGAMCVSHAEMVCGQVAAMFPELSVDWVGTGIDGRTDAENKKIIARFLKDECAEDALDVLVHVGMAGEGLDSRLVSEVIHLNHARINNSNHQENGRAARYLECVHGAPVVGNINFDSSSEYATRGYVGENIERAFDDLLPVADEDDSEQTDPSEYERPPLPEDPPILIANVELEKIDSGSPEIKRMRAACAMVVGDHEWQHTQECLDMAINAYRHMRKQEAEEFNEASRLAQTNDHVNSALSLVTSRVMRKMYGDGRINKSVPGDIKKRINSVKRQMLGAIDKTNIETVKQHYQWLQRLDVEIIERGIPSWLA